MIKLIGRRLGLSPSRRVLCCMLHFARQVPTIPVQRRMQLAPLVAARNALPRPRPTWCSIFTRAYAILAAAHPELRRCYVSWPWAYLYEHPHSVATVAVERVIGGEEEIVFVPVVEPDKFPFSYTDERVRRYKTEPLPNLSSLRWNFFFARFPGPIRRLLFWIVVNVLAARRVKYVGTFGVSVYSSLGASSLHPLSILTSTLNWGVIEADGSVDVRLIYDHRVLNGANVARLLAELERILREQMTAELLGDVAPPKPTGDLGLPVRRHHGTNGYANGESAAAAPIG